MQVFTPFDPSLDHNPLWCVSADLYFPSATQNEINEKDAKTIAANGQAIAVVEGTAIHVRVLVVVELYKKMNMRV